MIPIIPLIWIAVWAIRAVQHERPGAPGATSRRPGTPPRGKLASGRNVFLAVFFVVAYFTLLILLIPIVEDVAAWMALPLGPDVTALMTPLLAGGVPAVTLMAGPKWLAWRVMRALGLRRCARAVIWFVPLFDQHDVDGFRALIDASLAWLGPPAASRTRSRSRPAGRADAWTMSARALEAALQGDDARADLLLGARDVAPRGARVPRVLRVFACEALAACAARRGQWDHVERWTRAGRGRGVRLWRLLARAQREPQITAARLWLTWLLAPERRRTLSHVRAAAARRGGPAQAVVRTPAAPTSTPPWARHVELLRHAGLGATLDPTGVLALLAQWDTRLGTDAEAAFRARAIELGVADGAAAWGRLRERISAELELLLDAAGVPAGALAAHGELGAALGRRLRERLFAALHACLNGGGRIADDELGTPLEEWERWAQLRAAAVRLEERAGADALQTAWHSGLRDAAWNRPCRVFNTYGGDAAQACQAMFTWTAQVAGRLGDEECARVNTSNAAIAAKAAT